MVVNLSKLDVSMKNINSKNTTSIKGVKGKRWRGGDAAKLSMRTFSSDSCSSVILRTAETVMAIGWPAGKKTGERIFNQSGFCLHAAFKPGQKQGYRDGDCPKAVVNNATQIPPARIAGSTSEPAVCSFWKASIIPRTVPKTIIAMDQRLVMH